MSGVDPIQRVMGSAARGIDRVAPLPRLARLDRDEPREQEDDDEERPRPRPKRRARPQPDDGLPHIDVRA